MRKRALRRSSLIAPFGPGALSVTPDGTSLVTAGLDHWFAPPINPNAGRFNPEEYEFHEWRLERELQVDYFALPPDHRESHSGYLWAEAPPNSNLTIPFLRFPRWHVCSYSKCGRLKEYPLVLNETPRCPYCAEENPGKRYSPRMIQARFIAICEDGHIQDFPWREWAHKSASPTCDKPLRVFGTGGASLAATFVSCECGARRSLNHITEVLREDEISEEHEGEERSDRERMTYLSKHLAKDNTPFLCRGLRPWLGEDEGQGCARPLHGTLRGATNVYYGVTRSAIYLPRGRDLVPSKLVGILEDGAVQGTIKLIQELGVEVTPNALRAKHRLLLQPFTDAQIEHALGIVMSEQVDAEELIAGDDPETAFRRAEHAVLRASLVDEQLEVRSQDLGQYGPSIRDQLALVCLIVKLRETRAFAGFSRLRVDETRTLDERKALLWRSLPVRPNRWLPAYKVFGEGIYLELDEQELRAWEGRQEVIERVETLARHYDQLQGRRSLVARTISPRYVLMHTLAHSLMNQLIFDCGYSSASLRERLYVSSHPTAPMAGLLIYTAAGDSEGTMGGLVRMGQPQLFERVVENAVAQARWCSNDPVCMELGASGGQGPDSCNLAACHSCALVPETSCEQFNRFLDRWTVVGDPTNPGLGFFGDYAAAVG